MEQFYSMLFAITAVVAFGLEFSKPAQQGVSANQAFFRFRNNYLLVWSLMMGQFAAAQQSHRLSCALESHRHHASMPTPYPRTFFQTESSRVTFQSSPRYSFGSLTHSNFPSLRSRTSVLLTLPLLPHSPSLPLPPTKLQLDLPPSPSPPYPPQNPPGGDWLQGPYVYALYSYYGFEQRDIGRLFIAGFGASLLVGTVVGSLADRYGAPLIILFQVL